MRWTEYRQCKGVDLASSLGKCSNSYRRRVNKQRCVHRAQLVRPVDNTLPRFLLCWRIKTWMYVDNTLPKFLLCWRIKNMIIRFQGPLSHSVSIYWNESNQHCKSSNDGYDARRFFVWENLQRKNEIPHFHCTRHNGNSLEKKTMHSHEELRSG